MTNSNGALRGEVLAGRGVVITGGGRGIGAVAARLLAEAGAAVVVSARSGGEIEAVAGQLRQAGHQALAVVCDVAKEEDVEALKTSAVAFLDGLGRHADVLVNNAGIAFSAPVKGTSLEDWNRILTVNATGTFLCTRAFLPGMAERGWGRVINVASIAGVSGAAYIGAYAASKHAVIGLTRCAAAEVAAKGVTVNAVCPGYVDTAMTEESVTRIVAKTRLDEGKARESIVRMNPQGRILDADEVAFQILSLCDERSRGINGHTLVLDGGALLS